MRIDSITDAEKEKMRRLYVDEQMPSREVVVRTGVSFSSFHRCARAGNWYVARRKMRKERGLPPETVYLTKEQGFRHIDAATIEEMHRLYVHEQLSVKEISARTGVKASTFYNYSEFGFWAKERAEVRKNLGLPPEPDRSRKGYDWVEAEYFFIIGTDTYADIARFYHMPYNTLRNRAKRYHWDEQRALHRDLIAHLIGYR